MVVPACQGHNSSFSIFLAHLFKIQLFTDLSALSYNKEGVTLFCTSGIYSSNLISLFMNIMRYDFQAYILKLQLPARPSSYKSDATN